MPIQRILVVSTVVFERSGRVGFVVDIHSYKKDSPSSGLFRVKVYNADAGASGHGMAQRNGTGMFPREVVQKPCGGFCQAKGPADLLS